MQKVIPQLHLDTISRRGNRPCKTSQQCMESCRAPAVEPIGEIEDVEEEYGLGVETNGGRPTGLPAARQLAAAPFGSSSGGARDFSFATRDVLQTRQGMMSQKLTP